MKVYVGTPGAPTTKPTDPNPVTSPHYYATTADGALGTASDQYQFNSWSDDLSQVLAAGGVDPYNGNLLQALYGLIGIRLNAPLNVYVATTGSDTGNNGLSSGSPFATIQHALSYVQSTYNTNFNNVYINVANGEYAGAQMTGPLNGGGLLFVTGANVADVLISNTAGTCFAATNNASMVIQNLTLSAGGTGYNGAIPQGWCLYSQSGGAIQFENVAFANATQGHIFMNGSGSNIGPAATSVGNYSIIGDAPVHMSINGNAEVLCDEVTLVGPFSFTEGFVKLNAPGATLLCTTTFNVSYASFTGTSPYYTIGNGCQIFTNGQPSNYFPGNAAGTIGTGGLYS